MGRITGSKWLVPGMCVFGVVGLMLPASAWVRLPAALVLSYAFLRMGFALIRGLAAPLPEPPPPGELRRVKLVYRCSVCGTEVRMTHASHEHPEAPRHCMDEMDLIKTADDFL